MNRDLHPPVSVVVPVRDEPAALPAALASVLAQDYAGGIEGRRRRRLHRFRDGGCSAGIPGRAPRRQSGRPHACGPQPRDSGGIARDCGALRRTLRTAAGLCPGGGGNASKYRRGSSRRPATPDRHDTLRTRGGNRNDDASRLGRCMLPPRRRGRASGHRVSRSVPAGGAHRRGRVSTRRSSETRTMSSTGGSGRAARRCGSRRGSPLPTAPAFAAAVVPILANLEFS